MKTKKRKIGSRIQASYFLIIIVFLISSAIIFNNAFKNYIIDQAESDLDQAGAVLINRLSKVTFTEGDNLTSFNDIRVLSRYESTQFLLVSKDGTITLGATDLKGQKLTDVLEKASKSEEIIYKIFPVEGRLSIRFEELVLYTTVSEITQISRVVNRGSFAALIVTSFIAIIISFFMRRQLTKPLYQLQSDIESYKEDRSYRPSLNTGDEFENLSDDLVILMDKIEEVNSRQKVFFQNASHELKTPLMSIQGYAEAIKDGVIEQGEMDHSLDVIIAESQRLKSIVEEMILLTKLDDISETFNFESCSLVAILDKAKVAVQPIFNSGKLNLVCHVDEEAIGNFDVEKITRVFINLLSNGARYASDTVTVSIQKKGSLIYVDLMDDGQGFEIGSEDKIFDRFYKSKNGGSGIGLALTKTIVERHGGTIKAVNNVGMGALFKMTFPVEKTL